MKNVFYILLILVTTFAHAQTRKSDFFRLYKGGNTYLKPIKYVLFDSTASYAEKKIIQDVIYFNIKGEQFVYKKNHKVDTCSVDLLQKIKLDNPADLNQNAFLYFKNKKEEIEKKSNHKILILFPVAGFNNYFKVYVLEKIKNDKLLKYLVDWEYSTF
ncbi:hypothetical protein [Flavobacterium degerlachei]|jgi:hypothetical protein|uniref:Uncharacterized protein n=1 Tax=Flavobacterium degerlachei TaxID=229203 RepID=A0A1H2QQP7_9FLAO|nr:hypothetical protein [Flavobacterium degerlachei]SDW08944.1 hypothetical protein SAMN05444338_101233 [Flavobacterium degerlachei]